MAKVRCRGLERVAIRWVLLTLVCAAGILTSRAGAAQTGVADTPFVYFRGDEWSLDGGSLSHVYPRWRTRQLAAERLARFPESANTVAWLAQADRLGDALDVLERIIDRQPARIADALEALNDTSFELRRDQSQGYQARLDRLIAAAGRMLPRLDREAAARLDIVLLSFEWPPSSGREEFEARRRAVLERHEGTTAARLAAVGITDLQRPFSSRLAELDAVADREPGSVVAAKARYTKAFHLAHNGSHFVREGGSPDPTERFLEVLAIVKDLESGRYPPCQWVDDAPELVTGFYAYQPRISPANAAHLLDGLGAFIFEHQSLLAASDVNSVPYVVTRRLPAIAAFLPDGVAAMERLFTEFAREWQDKAAAPYLKATWLDLRQEDGSEPLALAPRSPTHEADVRALLASAASVEGESVYARRALARLAEREFSDPASLAAAHAHFSEYLRRFGSVSDAWLIALRLGQVEQAQVRHGEAARRFAEVARAHPDEPVARALALAYAARASEDAGEFAAALPYYRAALTVWTRDIDDTMALDLPRPPAAPPPQIGDIVLTSNRTLVSRDEIDRRVSELARSLPSEGGLELERGRWLLRQERPRDAVPVLERVASRYARTAAGADAADLLPRTRLEAALALAETSNPSADPEAALAELDALGNAPFDATAGIAGIIGATLDLLQGSNAEADARLTASLRRWVSEGTRMHTPPRPDSPEHDVLAVRDAVFLPMGGGLLGGGWNAFEWPATLPAFLVAPSALRVKVAGSDVWASVDVSRQPPGLTNVVFIPLDDVAYLTRAVSRLGGTRRREPTAIMQVPNQPVGDAQAIIRWWNRFFPARPGHWVGFDITTYPAFSSIEFTNAERSRALVPVNIGYAGADVVLEKVDGVWTIKELVNRWIT
jgi:tetratricopeptide (TPR) repeat protein